MIRVIEGQTLEDDGIILHFHIKKPIYGHCVAVNETILRRCEQLNRLMEISCPGKKETLTPQEWRDKSKRISKVFKYPDNPMILWQGTIGRVIKDNKSDQLTLAL